MDRRSVCSMRVIDEALMGSTVSPRSRITPFLVTPERSGISNLQKRRLRVLQSIMEILLSPLEEQCSRLKIISLHYKAGAALTVTTARRIGGVVQGPGPVRTKRHRAAM